MGIKVDASVEGKFCLDIITDERSKFLHSLDGTKWYDIAMESYYVIEEEDELVSFRIPICDVTDLRVMEKIANVPCSVSICYRLHTDELDVDSEVSSLPAHYIVGHVKVEEIRFDRDKMTGDAGERIKRAISVLEGGE